MPAAYARLPNPRTERDADEEMRAAFDEDSDDEQDERRPLNAGARRASNESDRSDASESHPLARSVTTPTPSARPTPAAGTYDFERVDYDYPPPGSPPPATRAFANDWGNSNGLVPSPSTSTHNGPRRGGRVGQAIGRVLPAGVAQRLGLAAAVPAGIVGGGSQNDGVFANVTAKPSRQIRVQDGTLV